MSASKDIARGWMERFRNEGAEACAHSIRDEVIGADERQLENVEGALHLLQSGLLLTPEELRALEAVRVSETGSRLTEEVVDSPRIVELRQQRDELQQALNARLGQSEQIAADQKALTDLRVQRNQLQRLVEELRKDLEQLGGCMS